MKELTNPVSGYNLTLMAGGLDEVFGWIELLNGDEAASYIYIQESAKGEIPKLSHKGTYIVMHQPVSMLGNLLSILRKETKVSIRFFDPESPGVTPSAFLVTGDQDVFSGEEGETRRAALLGT